MLKPDYLLHISEGAEAIAEQLHIDIINRIVERVMIRIGRGDSYLLTAQDKWQIEVLQDAGYLLEDIQKEIAKRTQQQEKEIAVAMENAGVRALSYDDAIYQAAGLSPVPLLQSPALMRLMQRNYEATLGEWQNYTRTTANAAQQLFLKAVDKAYTLTASGAISYTQAVREAINEIVQDGVVVKYPSGHQDSIETATLRAVRTGISQATGAIQMARMEEMDWDIILTSAHVGARSGDGGQNPSNHLWWQGQFFSRTGRTPGLPLFAESTGYGTEEWGVVGLCGANCRHSFGPGDGVNNPFALDDIMYADNAKAEKLQQKQREIERTIRRIKRETMTLKTAVDNAESEEARQALDADYQKSAAYLQKWNTKYDTFCKENNMKPLRDRLEIARWDRVQAAAARGAAKQYENTKNENVYEGLQRKVNILGTGNAGGDNSQPRFIGKIDINKTNEALQYFGNQIRNSDIEHVYIINEKGQVYYNRGAVDSVSTGDIDLANCHVLHNHPVKDGIMSFGEDDFYVMRDNPTAKFHLVNKKYDYYVEVLKPIDISHNIAYRKAMDLVKGDGEDFQHLVMELLKKEGYIKYVRKSVKKQAGED